MKPEHKKYIFPVILIIALGFGVYANSMGGEFIWDDNYLVKENIYIKNPANIPKLFTKDIGAGTGLKSASYRPLQMLTYTLNYLLSGFDTRGYHLTNVLFHVLAALALFWFINIVFDNRILSLFTALLFVAHPVHTEAVTYISGRADSMALLFMLVSFIFYLKLCHSCESRNPRTEYMDSRLRGNDILYWILTVLTYICALLSRESTLLLPALLLLYHYVFKKKIKFRPILPILGVSLGYILLRALVIKTDLPSDTCATTLFQRLPGFFVAITNYMKLLFWPFSLHMEYGDRVFGIQDPRALFGALISALLLIYAFGKRNKDKLILFSTLWFFITLLPSSNLYPVNAYMAEHWLYLPSVGFFLLLAHVFGTSATYEVAEVPQPRRLRRFAVIIALLGFYSLLTVRQNAYWREPLAFYKRTLEYTTDSPRLYNDLGIEYYRRGKTEEAIAAYKKVIKLDPGHAQAYNNLGVARRDLGRFKEAISAYEKAIELNPAHARAYNNLGIVYSAIGEGGNAIAAYKKAIEINPELAEAYSNLGVAYSTKGDNKEAMASYERAIALDPTYGSAYNNLANIYKAIGRYKEAISLYNKAIDLGTKNPAALHNNIALAYFLDRQYGAAIRHYDRAIELGFKANPEFLKKLEPYRR